jgi:hypothetical protein
MKIRIKPEIAVSESGLLFNPRTGESFSVNPIGLDMVKLIKSGKGPEQIREEILLKYDTDAGTFERDYSDFILIMRSNHLLEEP